MKKISLSIFVALLAVSMAVPASAAKITLDGKYTNEWEYVDGNITPNNLLDNQELELNLSITEGEMFKAYLPLTVTTELREFENPENPYKPIKDRGLQISLGSKWYVSFVSEEASVWASKNDADGYKFAAVGDPMGIGNKVNLTIGDFIKNGWMANIPYKSEGFDNTLNMLLKGQFNFGPVTYTAYVSDNSMALYNYKRDPLNPEEYLYDSEGNKVKDESIIGGDYVTSINRLTVDLPYDITLGATASYLTKSHIWSDSEVAKERDKFSQLTLSADASYELPIENIGGKLSAAVAGMLQREGLPKGEETKTKLEFVEDSLGFFIGATDFNVGPVTLGLDFSLAQKNAFSFLSAFPSVPSSWGDKWSLVNGELGGFDRFYYITDSTSRYIPNTMILNANASSNFNIGKVGLELKLNNKLNMATSDIEELGDKFSKVVNNITTLKTTFAITDDISVNMGTILDYRFAKPYTGEKLVDGKDSAAYPVVDGTVGAKFEALGLSLDARVRYYGTATEPVEGVVWGKFTRDLAVNDTISVTPTVAAAITVKNADKAVGSEDRVNAINGVVYAGVSSNINKFTVDGAYLLKANKAAKDDAKLTASHVANVTAGVKLSEIFTLKAGYTFRTDLSTTDKAKRHFVNAKLIADVSENTELTLTYGVTGLGSTSSLRNTFDQSKPWASLYTTSKVGSMQWDKIGLSLSIGF